MTDGWNNSQAWPVEPQQEPLIPLELQERLKAEGLPVNNDSVLLLWQKSKELLERAKADEMDIRKTAVKIYVPKPNEGMNTVELGNGYELKAQIKYNYNLADNDTVEACLNKIAAIGNQGAFIADRLVSWTPNFLLTEYRTLQEEAEKGSIDAIEIMKIIPEMLTISEAAPTLNIKEPKQRRR